jgi:glycosidase
VLRVPELRFFALAAGAAVLGGACKGGSYPVVDCHQAVWAKAEDGVSVSVVGSWDGWSAPGVAAGPSGYPGWQAALLTLPPGQYGYQVVVEGVVGLDPFQPLTTFRDDTEVSLLVAADCSTPALSVQQASADASGALSLAATFSAAAGGPPLDPASVRATIDGAPAAGAGIAASPADGALTVAAGGLAPGKHTVVVDASDGHGKVATARAAVWVKPAAETWDDAVLYQIVTDRFRGDGGAPLSPPPTPGTRAGGTLSGITAEIERGTFAALGVTALWISPVYTNPDDFRLGLDGHLYQGYHGYWPLADRAVDPHLGGEAALDALIASAHRHGLRVLFDIVPHHVYEKNPLYLAHQHDGWFDDGADHCICGTAGCSFATYIETCWFASYLPAARWQNDGAMEGAVDDALFWMSRFDADGVRIDAVPMMQRATTRRIVRALRESEAPARALFSVGEVFTGGGGGGLDQIKYYLGPDGLDSAFDFPLMWAMRDAIATDAAGFDEVEATLALTEQGLAGSGSILARMLDNHDTTRFLSAAAGDDDTDPWSAPPPQPAGGPAYARQRLALGLVFSLPGVPVIYYGDEIGLAGASDPDSRRVMPSLDGLSPEQQATRSLVERLGALRACSTALRRGARVPVWDDAETLAFVRDAGDGAPALALFSRAQGPAMVTVPGGVVPPGDYVDAVTGAPVTLGGAATVPLDPLSFKILVSSSSPCRP